MNARAARSTTRRLFISFISLSSLPSATYYFKFPSHLTGPRTISRTTRPRPKVKTRTTTSRTRSQASINPGRRDTTPPASPIARRISSVWICIDLSPTAFPTSTNVGKWSLAYATDRSMPCTEQGQPQPSHSTAGSPAVPHPAPPATTGTSRTFYLSLCTLRCS